MAEEKKVAKKHLMRGVFFYNNQKLKATPPFVASQG